MTAPVFPPPETAVPPQSAGQEALQILALVKAQAAARELLTSQTVDLVTHLVQGFDGWYDHEQITGWAGTVAKRVEPLLRTLARSTAAYQGRAVSTVAGRRVRPVGAVDVTSLRAGDVTHAGAYARAVDVYRWQQSRLDQAARLLATAPAPEPPDLVSPLEAAVQRAADVAGWDTQLTVRDQSQASMVAAHRRGLVTGWRRVIHPELSKGGTCGLCIAASDRLYGATEPMPLHARCNCVPMPVRDGKDPGSLLNDGDLRRLYSDATSTSGRDLKAIRYQVDHHGELGPVLNPRGAPFRGPRQVKRDSTPPRPPKTAEEKAADLRRVRESLTPALERARALAADKPKKWGSYLTQLEARISDLDHQLAA